MQPLGARALWNLVRHLPDDSALRRDIDPEGSRWGTTAELLASLIEVVDFGNRNFIAANSKRGARAPAPIRIPRPGVKEPNRRGTTTAELKGRWKEHIRVIEKEQE